MTGRAPRETAHHAWMTWRWTGPVVLMASLFWTSSVAAQETAPRLHVGAELRIRDEAREVFGLYTAAGCVLGAAALMGVGGGFGLPSGDTISIPAAITLLSMPLVATICLTLLVIAGGYDAGLGLWNAARQRRTHDPTFDELAARRELSTAIAWVYGVGATVMGLSVLSLVPIALIDGFHTPIYVLPTVVGSLGLFTLLGATGMDIAAGAWSGFSASIAPLEGGAMVSSSGSF